jgi:hypothetical protein
MRKCKCIKCTCRYEKKSKPVLEKVQANRNEDEVGKESTQLRP